MQMDATAALHSILNAAGKTPVMNALAAEIVLRLECADVHTLPEHLSGTLNFHCDSLSRLSQGAAIPDVLLDIPRETVKDRSASFFWAWPRALGVRTERVALNACGPGDCVSREGPTSQPLARPDVQLHSRARVRARQAREEQALHKDEEEVEHRQFQ